LEYDQPEGALSKLVVMDKYMQAQLKKASKRDVGRMEDRIEELEKKIVSRKLKVKRAETPSR